MKDEDKAVVIMVKVMGNAHSFNSTDEERHRREATRRQYLLEDVEDCDSSLNKIKINELKTDQR